MKYDIILAGVGGQGGLSASVIIAKAAMEAGLEVKQSEVHGMSQRGGAVQAHLRLSDREIHSPLIPEGTASLILSFEPLEGLRYLPYLAPGGTFATATQPVKNIPDYPELENLYTKIRAVPGARLVEAEQVARDVGAPRAFNVVLLGAVAHLLPIGAAALEKAITQVFAGKGEKIVDINVRAFRAGQALSAQG